MDILPDDALEYIIRDVLKTENPKKIYTWRSLSNSFRRVIDNYRYGFRTYYIDNMYGSNDVFYKNFLRYSSSSIKGLLWSVQNGFLPNDTIFRHKCLNNNPEHVDTLLKAIEPRDLYYIFDNVTQSNNIHALEWFIKNKVSIKPGMLFNIKMYRCLLMAVQNYTDTLYFVNHDRFINHICNTATGTDKMHYTNTILEIMYPILEDKDLERTSYNDLIRNTTGELQKKYIINNINKYLEADYNTTQLSFHLSIVVKYCYNWETVKQCFDIVDKKQPDNQWIFHTIDYLVNKSNNWKIQRNYARNSTTKKSNYWDHIPKILYRYKFPKDTIMINAIYRSLAEKVDNNIIKQLINIGFEWSFPEIVLACNQQNKEIMKILAERLD